MSSSPNSSSSSVATTTATATATPTPLAPGVDLTPLNDVVCQVDVMLGGASMSVRDCLALRRDAIIRLTKSAGGDMQVLVNGIVVAYGEVVILDESTAVRITELVAPPSNEVGE
jgi:flagellar motor switch protein FliN